MFSDPFYHSTLRKTVIAFGSLFDQLYVTRMQDGNEVKIKVPILYSPKEKYVQRYKDSFNRDNKDATAVQIILPEIGYEIAEIAYDPSRKKPSVNKRIVEKPSNSDLYKSNYTEVPYNVNFNLTAYVRYMDDGLQIIEQILPYFTPDFTVAIKQNVLGGSSERMNIPFVLNTVNIGSDYEGSMEVGTPRMILWDLSFTARINLFGPMSAIGVIEEVNINLFGNQLTYPPSTVEITEPPVITSVFPVTGLTTGGTPITITGTDLTDATSVTVGGVAATSVVVVSATSITAVTPAGTEGAKDVAVTTAGGTASLPSAFTFFMPSVYGSIRAGQFLKDLVDGTNSLDVIIIGDSNTGSALIGGYGYMAGMSEALNNIGAPCYGTPLAPFIDRSPTGAYRFYSTWRGTQNTIPKDSNYKSGLQASTSSPVDTGAVPYTIWNTTTPLVSYGSSTVQGTLTGVTITSTTGGFQCNSAYLQINQLVAITGVNTGTGSITGYATPSYYYITATNGTTTFSLSATYGGTNITTTAGSTTGLTFGSQADFNDWLYITPTPVGTNLYQTKGINLDETHPLAAKGVTNYLRVRYGKMPNGGQFIPLAFSAGAANGLTNLLSGAVVSTEKDGTQPTFDLHEESFIANGKGHSATALGYNYPSGTVFTKGPSAFFCQSLYRKEKGWAVQSHAYQSGDDSTRIYNILFNTTTWLEYQLKEIRERQISAGGTGRVLLFFHSGINGGDTGSTWTDAHNGVWKRYKIAWATLGYPATDLAIISIVGVQKNSEDISGNNTDLIAVRAAANAMVIENTDMTVVDIKVLMPYAALIYGNGNSSYYQRLNGVPNAGEDQTVHLSGGLISSHTGTATTTTLTSITLTGDLAVATDGYWVDSPLDIGTINGSADVPAYQSAFITEYNGTTKVATVNQWTGGQPTNGATSNITIYRKHLSDGYTVISQVILSSLINKSAKK